MADNVEDNVANNIANFLRRPNRVGDDVNADDRRRRKQLNKHNWHYRCSIFLIMAAFVSLILAVISMNMVENKWPCIVWLVISVIAGFVGWILCFRYSTEVQTLGTVNPNDIALLEMQPIRRPPRVVSQQSTRTTPERRLISGISYNPATSQAEVRDPAIPGPSWADAMNESITSSTGSEESFGSESQRSEFQSVAVPSGESRMSQAASSIVQVAAGSISSRTRSSSAKNESGDSQQASKGLASPDNARWVEGKTLRHRKSTPDLRAASSDRENKGD